MPPVDPQPVAPVGSVAKAVENVEVATTPGMAVGIAVVQVLPATGVDGSES
jgi:hypothetical protein